MVGKDCLAIMVKHTAEKPAFGVLIAIGLYVQVFLLCSQPNQPSPSIPSTHASLN